MKLINYYKKCKKGMSTPDLFFSAFSTLILIIFLIIFLSIFMRSCSENLNVEINERRMNLLTSERILFFLMQPVEIESSITQYHEKAYFNEGNRKISLPLELNNFNQNFKIHFNNSKNIVSASMKIKDGSNSNIALIHGSLDNVLPILEDELMFPDIILWNELSEDHDYVIAGCSSPTNYNRNNLLNWISDGGTLITTDHSIKIIEDLFGKEYVYSSENVITQENVKISFKSNSNDVIGSSGGDMIKDLFSLAIKNQSIVLAEYENVDDEFCKNTIEGCGYPIHTFDHGEGKIIHFAFHLDSNEEIAKNLFKTFSTNYFKPNNFKIYKEENLIQEFEDPFSDGPQKIDLISFLRNCEMPCEKIFSIKGDGKILIDSPIIEFSPISLYKPNQISLFEFIVKSISLEDFEKLIIILKKIADSMDTQMTGYVINIYLIPDDEKIISVYSENFRKFIYADIVAGPIFNVVNIYESDRIELPLYDSNNKIKIEILTGVNQAFLYRKAMSTVMWGIP